jgi:large subunit ribosomal protein L30
MMETREKEDKQLKIKLIKSGIGFPEKQKKVIHGLGFSRLNQIILRPDTPQVRGMIFKIRHLVEVVND